MLRRLITDYIHNRYSLYFKIDNKAIVNCFAFEGIPHGSECVV